MDKTGIVISAVRTFWINAVNTRSMLTKKEDYRISF
jgi:hypothetical protein